MDTIRLTCEVGKKIMTVSVWLLLFALFAPILHWLAHVWTTSMYDAQGCLVPCLVSVMLWWRRREILSVPRQPTTTGLWLTAGCVFIFLLAQLVDLKLLGGVALVGTIAGVIWSLWGLSRLRAVLFPVGLLLLMLPVNYPLEIFAGFPLRVIAAKLTWGILKTLGLDVSVQGTMITTPHFQVAIESPCSGLKTLSALFLVSLVLSFFLHRRLRDRMVILGITPFVAVFANAIRNAVITLIGHYYGREYAVGFLHMFSGLVVFLLAVGLLIVVSELLLWHRKCAYPAF